MKKAISQQQKKKSQLTLENKGSSSPTQNDKSAKRKKNIIYMPIPMPYPQYHQPQLHQPHLAPQQPEPIQSVPLTNRSNGSEVQPVQSTTNLFQPAPAPIMQSCTWSANIPQQYDTGRFHNSGQPGQNQTDLFANATFQQIIAKQK